MAKKIKKSISNKVKGIKLGKEETKDLYRKITTQELKPVNDSISVEYELDVPSQKAVRIREAAIEKVQEKTPDVSRGEALAIVREKNFSTILNEMLSNKLDEEYCIEHGIDFIPGMTGKELMMLKQAERAMQGDLKSAKFIVERVDGKTKTINENRNFSLKGSLSEIMGRIDKNG